MKKNIKKGKITMTITMVIACFVLALVMSMQFKIASETDITSIENMREAELRTELANWKSKYEEVEKKYEETSSKIDEYKQKFKTILAEEELAIAYGVKKNEPVKTEKAKLPVTNTQPIENKKEETKEKRTVKIPDLTIKKLQESISKIDHKNNSKEKYILKLMEEVGELAKVVNEDVRMKDKGTIEEELQDVLYYITCLANIYGIDLEECIYLKEELNCKKYNRKNMFKD